MVLNETSSHRLVHERVWHSAQRTTAAGLHTLRFQAMSTHCQVKLQTADARLAAAFQNEVLDWVAWFEAKYSRFLDDSLISRINAAAGEHWVEIDAETEALFTLCQEMIFFTRGVFDPTALPLMKLWNWKARPPVVPAPEAARAARELVGWSKVERRKGALFLPRAGMMLDLGGIGKEYAVDRVLTMGLQRGIHNILVDFGQDVRAHGRPPGHESWVVGLEDPHQPGKCWTAVLVNNHAVATSGDYVRHFVFEGRRFGHIIDPRTGYPVDNGVLAVSVVAPHCTFAGILSTAAFVLGPRDGLEMIGLCPGVEGALVTTDNRFQTKGFNRYANQTK
jgi:thiamine biosynthesis lipoprotein